MRICDRAGTQPRHFSGSQVREGVAREYAAEALHKSPGARPVGLREDQRELVTSIAGHEVGRPNLTLQHRPQLAEHAIAGRLTEPRVDVPQPIDVEHHQGESQLVAPGPLEFVSEAPVERIKAGTPG